MKKMLVWLIPFILMGQNLSAEEIPPCFVQLERQFFSFRAVEQALSLYEVPQGAWGHITSELQASGALIPQKIRERANRLGKNPFNYPFDRKGASGILDAVLYETLVQVLDKWGVRDEPSRRGIYQYLKEQSAPLFRSCLGENVTMPKIGT